MRGAEGEWAEGKNVVPRRDDAGRSPLELPFSCTPPSHCQHLSPRPRTSALLLAGMAPSRKRKLRNSTIDSVNFFNEISGSSAPSRRNTTHVASTPPRSARPNIFDIPETPPKNRKTTPPRSEPLPPRQLRSRNIGLTTSKAISTLKNQPPPWSPFEHEETDDSSDLQDESNRAQDLGQDHEQDHNLSAGEEREEEEARQEEQEHEDGGLEEDPLPHRVNLWPDESDDASDQPSDDNSANPEDQPTSYQQEPKPDDIEVLIDNRRGVDQTKGHAHDDGLFVSSAFEIGQSDPDEEEYAPEESEGEEQRAQQLGAVDIAPADANEPLDEVVGEQGAKDSPVNEPSHQPRPRRNELQDLSRWLAQEIESSLEGALWEVLRDNKRTLRNVAIKPIPEYLKGANSEVTEMRQLYYDIINNYTLTSEAQKELRNLREAVRTEATRIFEYAAEEAPEETGEGAELLNQFEAHVVGPVITLATFGYRAYKMLGSSAYEQFEGILELLQWCATQITNYAKTSYLRGTKARSKALLLPLRRIIKALGMGNLDASRAASRASSRVLSSNRPLPITQGDVSYTQDDSLFTQWSQVADYDIPPSQRPWSRDEENALRDGVRRFSGRSPSFESIPVLVVLT